MQERVPQEIIDVAIVIKELMEEMMSKKKTLAQQLEYQKEIKEAKKYLLFLQKEYKRRQNV